MKLSSSSIIAAAEQKPATDQRVLGFNVTGQGYRASAQRRLSMRSADAGFTRERHGAMAEADLQGMAAAGLQKQ